MPNPKRRHSKTRGRKRRTHYKAEAPTLAVDPASGETHLSHRAVWTSDGKLMYKGRVIMEKKQA
ncbi:MAG: 50S ribosomal protein L32 [Bacteroidetes bacterium]|nr:MAG: 50S ribosomal protein L32 [Bacteroidota bacterium]